MEIQVFGDGGAAAPPPPIVLRSGTMISPLENPTTGGMYLAAAAYAGGGSYEVVLQPVNASGPLTTLVAVLVESKDAGGRKDTRSYTAFRGLSAAPYAASGFSSPHW